MKHYFSSQFLPILIGIGFFIAAIVFCIIGDKYYSQCLYCLLLSGIWFLISRIDFNYDLISDQKKEIKELTRRLEAIEANNKALSGSENDNCDCVNKKRRIDS